MSLTLAPSQSNFCVSVVKDFNKLKRYNIQSIVGMSEEKAGGQTKAQVPKDEMSKPKKLNSGENTSHCGKQETDL